MVGLHVLSLTFPALMVLLLTAWCRFLLFCLLRAFAQLSMRSLDGVCHDMDVHTAHLIIHFVSLYRQQYVYDNVCQYDWGLWKKIMSFYQCLRYWHNTSTIVYRILAVICSALFVGSRRSPLYVVVFCIDTMGAAIMLISCTDAVFSLPLSQLPPQQIPTSPSSLVSSLTIYATCHLMSFPTEPSHGYFIC